MHTSRYKQLRKELSFRDYVEFLFNERVCRGEADACWLWVGNIRKDGYGSIKITRLNGKEVDFAAHRLAYRFACSKFDSKLWVCHTCDNPPCCNPKHLFLGIPADNSRDRDWKGRQARGETHGGAKLEKKQLDEIWRLRGQGLLQSEIASRVKVGQSQVSSILRRKSWEHFSVNSDHWEDAKKVSDSAGWGEKNCQSKLTGKQVAYIWRLRGAGLSQQEIAQRFNVSRGQISNILTGKSWSHLPISVKDQENARKVNCRTKLTERDVRKILSLRRDGLSLVQIASRFGVKFQRISAILLRDKGLGI